MPPLGPDQPTLVGEAFTLRYMPAREDLNKLDVFRYRSHPQRKAIDINVPVGCGDAPVFPGDVILGDADDAIVIPAHLADEITNEAFEMTAFEDSVTEQVQNGRGIFGLIQRRMSRRWLIFRRGGRRPGGSDVS